MSSEFLPEEELLDISISTFTPLGEPESELYNLRTTESHQISWYLASVLSDSESWGSIRVTPFALNNSDLMISGTILESDGQTLKVSIHVVDSTGLTWVDKQYSQTIDYDFALTLPRDSVASWFQSLHRQIANDILSYRDKNIARTELLNIREVSSLKFATQFIPDNENLYLEETSSGIIKINRLPAINDPLFEHIKNMRNRNDNYLDAVQSRYSVYITRTNEPYSAFIRRSHVISQLVKAQIRKEEEDIYVPGMHPNSYELGTSSFASSPSDATSRLKSSSNEDEEIKKFNQAIVKVGVAFEQEMEPMTLEFDEHNVELSGTVDEQFQQWKNILGEMFISENSL